MRVCFWGTRGSYPASFSVKELSLGLDTKVLEGFAPDGDQSSPLPSTYGTHTSCVEVQPGPEGTHLLCDAGTGLIEFIESFNAALKRSKAPPTFHIFLSHLHWDHIMGFPFFAVKVPPKSHVILHGHHEATEAVFKSLFDTPVFPVAFKDLRAKISFDIKKPGSSFRIGSMKITSLLQKHPGLSYAYKFEDQGKSLIYSTDCEHPKGDYAASYPFVDFCKHADLLIFDAMSSLAEAQQRGWGHSTYKVGIELALWARAKYLMFFHHDPTLKDAALHAFLGLAQTYKQAYLKGADLPFVPQPLKLSMAFDTLSFCF